MTTLFRRNPATLHTAIGPDIVALNVERGLGYGLENVTAAVWELLETPQSLDSLCAALARQYAVDQDTCRREVAALLDEMREEQLVEAVAPPA